MDKFRANGLGRNSRRRLDSRAVGTHREPRVSFRGNPSTISNRSRGPETLPGTVTGIYYFKAMRWCGDTTNGAYVSPAKPTVAVTVNASSINQLS